MREASLRCHSIETSAAEGSTAAVAANHKRGAATDRPYSVHTRGNNAAASGS